MKKKVLFVLTILLFCFCFVPLNATQGSLPPVKNSTYYEEYPLVSYETRFDVISSIDYGFKNSKMTNKTLEYTLYNNTSSAVKYNRELKTFRGLKTTFSIGIKGAAMEAMLRIENTKYTETTSTFEIIVSPYTTLKVYSYQPLVRSVVFYVTVYKRTRSWPWVSFGDYKKIEGPYHHTSNIIMVNPTNYASVKL